MSDSYVTTSIVGAVFSDGSTLSGTWTAEYDAGGDLLAVSDALLTVSGSGGATTFTDAGTLPYANAATDSSYEIHFLAAPSGGSYQSLYVDWRSETPSSLYEGSPSLYSSVVNGAAETATPLRLLDDGTTGTGALPTIDNLPASQLHGDTAGFAPFGGVTVAAPDATTDLGAVITLSVGGSPTDADGALSGNGLVKTGIGTYSLASAPAADLSAGLDALLFTPAADVLVGGTATTLLNLYVNDDSGTAAAATTLNVNASCFLSGTMIATTSGEIAVELLQPGDRVLTARGGDLPVVGTAYRHFDCRRYRSCGQSHRILPVRIRAHTFGTGFPRRDLFLSPDHAVLVEEVLIPVKYLINGSTIAQMSADLIITYWHVALQRHDILLAEGLSCESFLQPPLQACGDGAPRHAAPGPSLNVLTWEALGCLPLVVAGPQLDRARQRLSQRDDAPMRKAAREAAVSRAVC